MDISYQPLEPGQPVKFVVKGFPEEDLIKKEIERFYQTTGQGAERKFLVYNTFSEVIFSGNVGQEGSVEELKFVDRQDSYRPEKRE